MRLSITFAILAYHLHVKSNLVYIYCSNTFFHFEAVHGYNIHIMFTENVSSLSNLCVFSGVKNRSNKSAILNMLHNSA